MSEVTGKKIAKNVILSMVAQIVSLLISFFLNLVVPKFIGEYDYAYWQMYILYIGYVGIWHFGITDGIVLRYAKYDYEDLDKPRLASQFRILLFINTIFSILTIFTATVGMPKWEVYMVAVMVAIGIITKNVFAFTSFLLQTTNRISKYVTVILAQRISYGLAVLLLLLLKVENFYWYCVADLLGDCIGIFIGQFFNRGLYFTKAIPVKEAFKETKENMTAGIVLMMANVAASLVVGSAKMLIQWKWGELAFGKVSFAFSATSLFLSFVTASSIVLFPTLKRLNQDRLPQMYKIVRGIVSPILFVMMLAYFPGCWILKQWLPNYAISLEYLGILLPIIIFSSKVGLITNNYLKAYRKEKEMLLVNMMSVGMAIILFLGSVLWLKNFDILLYSVVFVIMIRSVLSEMIVTKIVKVSVVSDVIIETIMTLGFVFCAKGFKLWIGFLIYLCILLVYLYINRNNLKLLVRQFIRRK